LKGRLIRESGRNLERKRRNKFRSSQRSHQIIKVKEPRVKTDKMTGFTRKTETGTACHLAEGNSLLDSHEKCEKVKKMKETEMKVAVGTEALKEAEGEEKVRQMVLEEVVVEEDVVIEEEVVVVSIGLRVQQ